MARKKKSQAPSPPVPALSEDEIQELLNQIESSHNEQPQEQKNDPERFSQIITSLSTTTTTTTSSSSSSSSSSVLVWRTAKLVWLSLANTMEQQMDTGARELLNQTIALLAQQPPQPQHHQLACTLFGNAIYFSPNVSEATKVLRAAYPVCASQPTILSVYAAACVNHNWSVSSSVLAQVCKEWSSMLPHCEVFIKAMLLKWRLASNNNSNNNSGSSKELRSLITAAIAASASDLVGELVFLAVATTEGVQPDELNEWCRVARRGTMSGSVNAELTMLVYNERHHSSSYTTCEDGINDIQRRVEHLLGPLENVLRTCMSLGDRELIERAATVAWHLTLPLLQQRDCVDLQQVLRLIATALQGIDSRLYPLRACVHLELAFIDVAEDYVTKGMMQLQQSIEASNRQQQQQQQQRRTLLVELYAQPLYNQLSLMERVYDMDMAEMSPYGTALALFEQVRKSASSVTKRMSVLRRAVNTLIKEDDDSGSVLNTSGVEDDPMVMVPLCISIMKLCSKGDLYSKELVTRLARPLLHLLQQHRQQQQQSQVTKEYQRRVSLLMVHVYALMQRVVDNDEALECANGVVELGVEMKEPWVVFNAILSIYNTATSATGNSFLVTTMTRLLRMSHTLNDDHIAMLGLGICRRLPSSSDVVTLSKLLMEHTLPSPAIQRDILLCLKHASSSSSSPPPSTCQWNPRLMAAIRPGPPSSLLLREITKVMKDKELAAIQWQVASEYAEQMAAIDASVAIQAAQLVWEAKSTIPSTLLPLAHIFDPTTTTATTTHSPAQWCSLAIALRTLGVLGVQNNIHELRDPRPIIHQCIAQCALAYGLLCMYGGDKFMNTVGATTSAALWYVIQTGVHALRRHHDDAIDEVVIKPLLCLLPCVRNGDESWSKAIEYVLQHRYTTMKHDDDDLVRLCTQAIDSLDETTTKSDSLWLLKSMFQVAMGSDASAAVANINTALRPRAWAQLAEKSSDRKQKKRYFQRAVTEAVAGSGGDGDGIRQQYSIQLRYARWLAECTPRDPEYGKVIDSIIQHIEAKASVLSFDMNEHLHSWYTKQPLYRRSVRDSLVLIECFTLHAVYSESEKQQQQWLARAHDAVVALWSSLALTVNLHRFRAAHSSLIIFNNNNNNNTDGGNNDDTMVFKNELERIRALRDEQSTITSMIDEQVLVNYHDYNDEACKNWMNGGDQYWLTSSSMVLKPIHCFEMLGDLLRMTTEETAPLLHQLCVHMCRVVPELSSHLPLAQCRWQPTTTTEWVITDMLDRANGDLNVLARLAPLFVARGHVAEARQLLYECVKNNDNNNNNENYHLIHYGLSLLSALSGDWVKCVIHEREYQAHGCHTPTEWCTSLYRLSVALLYQAYHISAAAPLKADDLREQALLVIENGCRYFQQHEFHRDISYMKAYASLATIRVLQRNTHYPFIFRFPLSDDDETLLVSCVSIDDANSDFLQLRLSSEDDDELMTICHHVAPASSGLAAQLHLLRGRLLLLQDQYTEAVMSFRTALDSCGVKKMSTVKLALATSLLAQYADGSGGGDSEDDENQQKNEEDPVVLSFFREFPDCFGETPPHPADVARDEARTLLHDIIQQQQQQPSLLVSRAMYYSATLSSSSSSSSSSSLLLLQALNGLWENEDWYMVRRCLVTLLVSSGHKMAAAAVHTIAQIDCMLASRRKELECLPRTHPIKLTRTRISWFQPYCDTKTLRQSLVQLRSHNNDDDDDGGTDLVVALSKITAATAAEAANAAKKKTKRKTGQRPAHKETMIAETLNDDDDDDDAVENKATSVVMAEFDKAIQRLPSDTAILSCVFDHHAQVARVVVSSTHGHSFAEHMDTMEAVRTAIETHHSWVGIQKLLYNFTTDNNNSNDDDDDEATIRQYVPEMIDCIPAPPFYTCIATTTNTNFN